MRIKGRNSLSTKFSNQDTAKLGKTGSSDFMVTVTPGEQEDPILKPRVGSLMSLLVSITRKRLYKRYAFF